MLLVFNEHQIDSFVLSLINFLIIISKNKVTGIEFLLKKFHIELEI